MPIPTPSQHSARRLEPGYGQKPNRRRSAISGAALGLLAQACVSAATASTAPPPTAADGIAQPATPAPRHCGLVRRAARCWVGLGEGMTLNDMPAAAEAAQAVVQALDEAICAVLIGLEDVAPLMSECSLLRAAVDAGASLEVTQVILKNASGSAVSAQLRAIPSSASPAVWQAQLQARNQIWYVTDFSASAPDGS